MIRKTLLVLLWLVATLVQAQTKLTATQVKAMFASKSYGWASIHDPSIVYNPSDSKYYIIGSHRGLAQTTDLVNLSGLNSSQIYSSNYSVAFSACPTHEVQVTRSGITTTETLQSYNAGAYCATYAGIKVGDRQPTTEANWINGDQWAPDMVYNPNMGKWCMYLSLNGDYWASVIVLLTADSPKGPFTYQAPIVFSGFNGQTYSGKGVSYKDTDLEIVLGTQASLPSRYKTTAWGNLWPNCIDPCVFFDDDGELWMAYGSWSGGIFMLKLDKNTGLRDYTTTYATTTYSGKAPNGASYTGYTSDPYFGKLIAGGAYVSGEGPYIRKIGNYYYLFMSYGGFAPDGGYEMRVFRSSTPNGNYVDAIGNNARYTQYVLNYGSSATTNKGMKLIGAMNNWGTMTVGECAQGHNSAIVDKDGDAFVIYHTKFNDGTAGHQVRIRQLFVNEKGWLVASPFRYTGKQTTQDIIENKELFSADSIAGTYSLLLHPYKLNHGAMAEATPVKVTLSADGKITGDKSGSWKYSEQGKSYVTIVLGGVTYYGVALDQNVDGYADMPALCFTAVSNSGVPVWLYKYHPRAAVASAYTPFVTKYLGSSATVIDSNAPIVDNVTSLFEVTNSTTGEKEPETLSPSGVFTPTEDGHKISIYMTLSSDNYYMKLGPYSRQTQSVGNVPATPICYPVSSIKNTTSAWWSNFSTEDYKLEQGKSIEFQFYNYSNQSDNWCNWALYGANVTHGASNYTEYFGIRCDNWDNTTMSNTGCVSDYNWNTFVSDMNGSLVKMTVNYNADGVFNMSANITTTSGKTYNYSYTKTISAKPQYINLFFVNEKSYIDGTNIPTAMQTITAEQQKDSWHNGKIFNMAGQEVGNDYKGIVIINGRKYIKK